MLELTRSGKSSCLLFPVQCILVVLTLSLSFSVCPSLLWKNRDNEQQMAFKAKILHCKAILDGGQLGLMRWILLWIKHLVQDQALEPIDLQSTSVLRLLPTLDIYRYIITLLRLSPQIVTWLMLLHHGVESIIFMLFQYAYIFGYR